MAGKRVEIQCTYPELMQVVASKERQQSSSVSRNSRCSEASRGESTTASLARQADARAVPTADYR